MSLKILIINWQDITNPLGGGAEVHLHEIFKRIAQKGHQVTLLCCRYPNAECEEIIDDIRIVRQGNRNLFNYIVPKAYRHLNKKNNFDIIIDDINKIPFYTPLFVKKPLIGIIHHLFGSSIFLEAPLPFAVYVNLSEKLIPLIYHKTPVAVVSESTQQELIQKGFEKEKLPIIYNGVDTSFYKALNINKNPTPLIGYLGRIKKYKSVEHLLKAFRIVLNEIPDANLLVMGDGDYLSELKKLSSALQMNHAVSFTGAANANDKVTNLNKIWFTVNPSPKEGWGLTVIESNACGTPVIAANSPGLRDSVVNGKTGMLYDYGNCQQLAEKIIQLIEQYELRQEFSVNCLEWAKKFTWEESANRMMKLIEETYCHAESKA